MTASERNRWCLSRSSGARNCVQYIAAPAITVFPASRAQRKQKYMSITLRGLTKLALFSGTTGGVEFYGESIEERRLRQKSGKDFVNFEIFVIKVWGRIKVFWRLKWRPWGDWRVQRREGALRLWFRNESNLLNTNTIRYLLFVIPAFARALERIRLMCSSHDVSCFQQVLVDPAYISRYTCSNYTVRELKYSQNIKNIYISTEV